MVTCGFIGVLCGVFLPPAGLYLPSSKKTGKNKVQLIDRQTEHTYLDMMIKPTRDTNYAVHSMSFNETFTEKKLKVQRVRLNETRLDPDLYIQFSRMYSRMNRITDTDKKEQNKKLDKAWGVNRTYADEN